MIMLNTINLSYQNINLDIRYVYALNNSHLYKYWSHNLVRTNTVVFTTMYYNALNLDVNSDIFTFNENLYKDGFFKNAITDAGFITNSKINLGYNFIANIPNLYFTNTLSSLTVKDFDKNAYLSSVAINPKLIQVSAPLNSFTKYLDYYKNIYNINKNYFWFC